MFDAKLAKRGDAAAHLEGTSPPPTAREIRRGAAVAIVALLSGALLWRVPADRFDIALAAYVSVLVSSRSLWILLWRAWRWSRTFHAPNGEELGVIELRRGSAGKRWRVTADGRVFRSKLESTNESHSDGVRKRGCVLLLQVFSWWDVAFGAAGVSIVVGLLIAWKSILIDLRIFVLLGTWLLMPVLAFLALVHSMQPFMRVRDVALGELGGSFDPENNTESFRFDELTRVARLGPFMVLRSPQRRWLVASVPFASWGHVDILEAIVLAAAPGEQRSRWALTSSWFATSRLAASSARGAS